jgi:hypothetical protein
LCYPDLEGIVVRPAAVMCRMYYMRHSSSTAGTWSVPEATATLPGALVCAVCIAQLALGCIALCRA